MSEENENQNTQNTMMIEAVPDMTESALLVIDIQVKWSRAGVRTKQ